VWPGAHGVTGAMGHQYRRDADVPPQKDPLHLRTRVQEHISRQSAWRRILSRFRSER